MQDVACSSIQKAGSEGRCDRATRERGPGPIVQWRYQPAVHVWSWRLTSGLHDPGSGQLIYKDSEFQAKYRKLWWLNCQRLSRRRVCLEIEGSPDLLSWDHLWRTERRGQCPSETRTGTLPTCCRLGSGPTDHGWESISEGWALVMHSVWLAPRKCWHHLLKVSEIQTDNILPQPGTQPSECHHQRT